MAYIETTKIKDADGVLMTPAKDDSLTLLRRIFQLLKPLGVTSGLGSNRLSVDVSTVTALPTLANVTTVATVTTVTTVNNQNYMAGIQLFELLKSSNRAGYNTGIRANIT
jgi:hypothetical protein